VGAAGRAGLATSGLPGRRGAGAAPLSALTNNEGAAIAPELAMIQRELKRPGVTLELLWQEYRDEHPIGYSRFCDLFSGMAEARFAHDAADACRWRAHVRRLPSGSYYRCRNCAHRRRFTAFGPRSNPFIRSLWLSYGLPPAVRGVGQTFPLPAENATKRGNSRLLAGECQRQ
jgi:hypothetical protein